MKSRAATVAFDITLYGNDHLRFDNEIRVGIELIELRNENGCATVLAVSGLPALVVGDSELLPTFTGEVD